ncbi:unnamed protein product [Parnassius apollo]|uniref:(apollo) hypothetical protein n=1 Tax=Parnassius apollo TaxID=110799 RepID=A0A8S3X0E6_PARAO|nr:unnamed protein product [Parnassius apollo]
MEEESAISSSELREAPQTDSLINGNVTEKETNHAIDEKEANVSACVNNKDESGVILDGLEDNKNVTVESFLENEVCEVIDDARSLGDLDSLPAGDELALGAAGSDSGVEGCGRALSSGGGSRSCASSVVSCGSGCGSESSSLAGAPLRTRRRVNVTVIESKKSSPLGSSTPRPTTAPRGPNLATRERARSREKPTPPEKPRPLTPKPRIRPTTDLPNLIRESPALRAKPTKTSTARCRTPNSPSDDKKWPPNGPRLTPVSDSGATRVAADKYGTLPRRRREADTENSPKHENTPPTSRRPTITRSASSRSTVKTRVRIYAEKNCQTVLIGTDIESALAGIIPSIESRIEVSRCHRGVQASARDVEAARLAAAAAAAEASAAEERERRLHAEAQLAAERAARLSAIAELERNSQRLLELAGAGAGAGAEGCLRALEEQLRSAGELAARQRGEIDTLREHCNRLHSEALSAREAARIAEARLVEAEREATEMQDFLAAETSALSDSLRDADAELVRLTADLERRRAECRQLVRMCEQRRQEALAAAARARCGGGAAPALDALARRLRALTDQVLRAYALPRDAALPTLYHNDAYHRYSTALDALAHRLRALTDQVLRAYALPRDAALPTLYHNDAYHRYSTALDALARRLRALSDRVLRAYAQPREAALPTLYHNDAYHRYSTALDALARRLRALTDQVLRAYAQPRDAALPTLYHNDAYHRYSTALDALAHRLRAVTDQVLRAYALPRDAAPAHALPQRHLPQVQYSSCARSPTSHSDSGEQLSPDEEARGGLLGAIVRALRSTPAAAPAPAPLDDERSRVSDDNDNSADLLDSETEPCLVTDPECLEEWWSGAEGCEGAEGNEFAGAWSGEELSPERESYGEDREGESASASERESLRNLSAAITQRQRSEAEDAERGSLLERVLALDARLSELLRALRLAAARAHDAPAAALAHALRDKIDVTEKNVADVVVKKLAELDASKNMMEQYRQSVETLKKQVAQYDEEDDVDIIEKELASCDENERRQRYEALDAALSALAAVDGWARASALQRRLERLAFALAAPPAPAPAPITNALNTASTTNSTP